MPTQSPPYPSHEDLPSWDRDRDRDVYRGGDRGPRPDSDPYQPEDFVEVPAEAEPPASTTPRDARDPGAELAAGGHRGHGPVGYGRTDELLRDEICDRLTDDDAVDARDIEVQVASGEVTLTGTVPSAAMKVRAQEIAASVPGVVGVDDRVELEHSAPA